MHKAVQIIGVFDVNALVRQFGNSNIHVGQSVLLGEEDLAQKLASPPEQVVAVASVEVRQVPQQPQILPTASLEQILYGHDDDDDDCDCPDVLSENDVERIVNNDPTMDEEALEAFLNNDQVQCFTDTYEFLDWVPNNALPGDKLVLKDMLGNIVATVSVPRHFNAN